MSILAITIHFGYLASGMVMPYDTTTICDGHILCLMVIKEYVLNLSSIYTLYMYGNICNFCLLFSFLFIHIRHKNVLHNII